MILGDCKSRTKGISSLIMRTRDIPAASLNIDGTFDFERAVVRCAVRAQGQVDRRHRSARLAPDELKTARISLFYTFVSEKAVQSCLRALRSGIHLRKVMPEPMVILAKVESDPKFATSVLLSTTLRYLLSDAVCRIFLPDAHEQPNDAH